MKNDEKLIPDLIEWRKVNGEDFSMGDWVFAEGDIRFAIAYLSVFFPDFMEYDGCVLLKDHFDKENFESWKNNDAEYYSEIEGVINHIHIVGLFHKTEEINREQILFLGTKLCEIYQMKLKNDFPDKEFIFYFNDNENYNDLWDYQFTFYQKDNKSRKIKR